MSVGPAGAGKKLVWSATPTPFLDNGALDDAGIERLVEHHVGLGVAGLFLGGTCGEGPYMPNAQRDELARKVKRLAGGRLHVALQVSDTSAARVRDNMARAADAGADSVVIAPPWLVRICSEKFLRRYFFETLDAARQPVGIYVLQQYKEHGLDLGLWTEIVSHPAVRYAKDSSASEDYIRALAAVKVKRPDLVVETGFEFDVLTAVAAGYDGCLLGTGILNAGMIRRAMDALQAGDADGARAWQKRSNDFLYDLFGAKLDIWLGGLKYALKRMGIFTSEWMHMAYPMTDADRRRIDAAIEREGDLIRPTAAPLSGKGPASSRCRCDA